MIFFFCSLRTRAICNLFSFCLLSSLCIMFTLVLIMFIHFVLFCLLIMNRKLQDHASPLKRYGRISWTNMSTHYALETIWHIIWAHGYAHGNKYVYLCCFCFIYFQVCKHFKVGIIMLSLILPSPMGFFLVSVFCQYLNGWFFVSRIFVNQ